MGASYENCAHCFRERRSARVVMHAIRCRRYTKRRRTGEDGKERTTRLIVALHSSG